MPRTPPHKTPAPAPARPDQPSELVAQPATGQAPSPAQKRFNQLLRRIDKTRAALAGLETLVTTQQPVFEQTLRPLQEANEQQLLQLVQRLDGWLQQPRLPVRLKAVGIDVVCILSAQLAEAGHADMAELHDRYSSASLEELREAEIAGLRFAVEDALGGPIDPDGTLDTDEALMAAMARLKEQVAAEQASRAAASPRKAGAKGQPAKAAQAREDAEALLRSTFRQLASALHPDREPDEAERARKTALMSEANAAYGRRDLLALLQLQQRATQGDPQAPARHSEEQLASMVLLLREQAEELDQLLRARQWQAREIFDLPDHLPLTANWLQKALLAQESEARMQLARLEYELENTRTEAGMRTWLKLQRQYGLT